MRTCSTEAVAVSPEQREQLESWVRSPTAQQRLVKRSRIVLLLADGLSESEVARRVGICRATVARWRQRLMSEGISELGVDRPGRGRKTYKLTQEKIQEIVDATHTEPPAGQKRWSLRSMAKQMGVAPASVYAVWKSHQLEPHSDNASGRVVAGASNAIPHS